ncbi:hypothetical protein BH23ACT4_BH23ACT4_04420 [soil metagenome]
MGAEVDCERIGPGFLGQPVNSLTAFVFIACGFIIGTRRPERAWVGIALAATGIGSFLFHGPMPAGSQWAHDVSLAWLLAVVPAVGTSRQSMVLGPGLVGLGIFFAVAPVLADPLFIALTALALVILLRRDRSMATLGPLSLLATSAAVGRLGASGWPLCVPDSLFQPHGLWHLGAAAAVTWWALAAPGPPGPPGIRGA